MWLAMYIACGASGATMGLSGVALAASLRYTWLGIPRPFNPWALVLVISLEVIMDSSGPFPTMLCHATGMVVGIIAGMIAAMTIKKPPHGS